VDEVVEKTYQQTLIHEGQLDSLKDYSYVQKIHFIKMDGDGEIEAQSKREFLVKVRSREQHERELIAAYDYEDDVWVNVTEKEKNKEQNEGKSVKFSLTEMVSPEARNNYRFTPVGDEFINGFQTLHLSVKPIEVDEDKFAGELWLVKDTYSLIKARLRPSENPTGIEKMLMNFTMSKINDIWLPVKITFEAEVSFLIIFKGKIFSEITFEDYRFGEG
jgi:hypothetical protein